MSRSTFPYFLYLLHCFQFPVFPILSCTFPPKILLSMPAPAYFLSHPSNLPPMYFLSLLHFLIPYFYSFPYFSCLSRTFPKILLSSRSLLQGTSYPFPLSFYHVLSCCEFYLLCLMCFFKKIKRSNLSKIYVRLNVSKLKSSYNLGQ